MSESWTTTGEDMDDRIAKLKTSQEARQLANNAQRLGRSDVAVLAIERSRELLAEEEGFTSPAERAIAIALYAYEDEQSRIKDRPFRANRTRNMLSKRGALAAAERIVLHRPISQGFKVLEQAGLQSLSFEAIIDRYPNEFSIEAVNAARARLQLAPDVKDVISSSTSTTVTSDSSDVRTAVLDGEAIAFLEGFCTQDNWFHLSWLPRYRRTIEAIAESLSGGRPSDLFSTLWREVDNSIANAGRGALRTGVADRMHEEFLQVIHDVHADGSPASHDRIVARFERWRDDGRIDMVPRLLIRRAFAGIHPNLYHTTVDASSQDIALNWFAKHTNFEIPDSKSWAVRARSLVFHLDRFSIFQDNVLIRNMFPWAVVSQLRRRTSSDESSPGHTPRPSSAFANLPSAQRRISLRHNRVQTELYRLLVIEHGEKRVWTERETGTGGYADAVVVLPDSACYLYEIKIADTAGEVVRQAMGQLLEYGFRRGGLEPAKLFVVGEPPLDDVTAVFIARLRSEFNLNLEYLQVTAPEGEDSTE